MKKITTDKNVPINEKAMLVKQTIKNPSFRKKDDVATTHLGEQFSAQYGALIANKSLFDKSTIAEAKSICNQARALLYHYTLPWLDNEASSSNKGPRLLPAKSYFEFVEKHREFEKRLEVVKYKLAQVWDDEVAKGMQALGRRADISEYPSKEEVAELWSVSLSIENLPDNDFRISSLGSEELSRLREEHEQRVAKRLNNATRHIYTRIERAVEVMHNHLSDPESNRFHSTLVTNLQELADVVPELNIAGDPELERLAGEITAKLCQHESAELKEHEDVRQETAEAAGNILEQLNDLTNQ